MKKLMSRGLPLIFLTALTISGCKSLTKVKPVAQPASIKTHVSAKPGDAAAQKSSRPLFIIERNKNANVVYYEPNLASDGSLDPDEPVIVYWVLNAEDGRRKKLNWLERKKAYGVRIKPAPAHNGYKFTLAAASWLPLTLKTVEGAVRAEVSINDRPAVIEKMFIQSKDRLLGPKVEYIQLYGNYVDSGEACSEKILPK